LYINKDHDELVLLLAEWKQFVFSSGRNAEDWDWLMDHYNTYDHPSTFSDQREWLLKAGFSNVVLSWSRGPWGCYHAYKE
jgi:hypothetical protein